MGQQEITGFGGRDGNDWWLLFEVHPVLTLDAQFVTQQGLPRTLTPGQRHAVSVSMRNAGSNTWTPGGSNPYRLGSLSPQGTTWGITRVELPHPVEPGSEVTFNFEITAPSEFGRYRFQWRVLQENVEWFGEPSTNVIIEVTD